MKETLNELKAKALAELEAFINRADAENKDKFLLAAHIDADVTWKDLKTNEIKTGYVLHMSIFNNEVQDGPQIDTTYVRFTKDDDIEDIKKRIAEAFPTQEQLDEMKKQEEARRAFQEQMQQQLQGMSPEEAAQAVNQMQQEQPQQ